jgi:hypothetical protein
MAVVVECGRLTRATGAPAIDFKRLRLVGMYYLKGK